MRVVLPAPEEGAEGVEELTWKKKRLRTCLSREAEEGPGRGINEDIIKVIVVFLKYLMSRKENKLFDAFKFLRRMKYRVNGFF